MLHSNAQEEELKQVNDKAKKLTATKSGLEKLVGFYAKDPAAQQKVPHPSSGFSSGLTWPSTYSIVVDGQIRPSKR